MRSVKSEQARKTLQAEGQVFVVPLLPEKADVSHKWRNLTLLFVALNLLVLAYLFFKIGTPPQIVAERSVTVAPPVVHPESTTTCDGGINTASIAWIKNTPAISDLWAENKQAEAADSIKSIVAKPKPVVKMKAVDALVSKEAKVLPKVPADEKMVLTGLEQQVLSLPKPEILAPPPAVQPEHSDIPLLRELPADFQAKVPPTTINVLAYADQPHERFVMIDMVKYRIGERINAKLSLLDILPESVVLSYEGQRFRLERP